MLGAVSILAAIAGLLFLLSLIPSAAQYPLVSVGGLLLAIALFLLGGK